MARHINTIPEVCRFLEKAKELSSDSCRTSINSGTWAGGRVNKTQRYMAETGITGADMRAVVQRLQVCNYSVTVDDVNPNFAGETAWIFGITERMIDRDENLYIKLKIRKFKDEILLILSFHPELPEREEDRLTFPYENVIV